MKLLNILCLFLISLPASIAQTKTGTSMGQFLLIEPSARVAGMGNAGVTAYGEIQAVYYNPAAAGYLQQHGVQFTHSSWLADISYDFAAVALNLGSFGNLVATVTALNSGDIEVRTVDQPLGTGELYSVKNLAIGLGYGRQISDRFSVGLQVTYVQETIWHVSSLAFGINVGTLYRVSDDGLHIGASVSNVGTRGKYDGSDLRIEFDRDPAKHGDNSSLPAVQYVEDYPLPILFRVGVGYPIPLFHGSVLRVALDAFHPSDNTESISLGAEWEYDNLLFFRVGYQNLFLQDSEVGLTFGGGIRSSLGPYALSIDYAWADHGRLTETHRLTLGVSF